MKLDGNGKLVRTAKSRSAWKLSVMALSVASALCAMPAYAQKVTCSPGVPVNDIGPDAVACGAQANTLGGDGAVAVGYQATATADRSTAVGRAAKALAKDSLALGAGATVQAGAAAGSIALGAGSIATGTSLGYSSYLTGTTAASELAIGGRRITGVADGYNNSDAATVGQLKAANVGNDLAVRYVWNDDGNRIVDTGEIAYNSVMMGVDPRTGLPVAGGTTISNVAAGKSATDAVNVSQLAGIATALGGTAKVDANTGAIVAPSYGLDAANKIMGTSGAATDVGSGFAKVDAALGAVNAVANKGFNISADGGATSKTILPGATANFAVGPSGNLTVSRTDGTIAYDVVANPTFSGLVTANGGLTVGTGQTVNMGGNKITNVASGTASTDAVNVGQLAGATSIFGGGASVDGKGAIIAPSYSLINANGIMGTSGAATDVGSGFAKVDAALGAVNAVANKGFNISADGGATSKTILPGATANFAVGSSGNLAVSRTDGTIAYDVVANPTFSGLVTANGGLTVGAGQTVNMGGNKVTNIASGTASTDAVNVSQLGSVVAAAGKWQLQANGGTADTITAADTVNVVNGVNTTAHYDAATNQLKVDVVDAPAFAGMLTANGGLTVGTGQVIDMGGNRITDVAAGSALSDAVNIDQLNDVTTALGGGSVVNADGTIAQPRYSLEEANGIAGNSGAATNVGDGFNKVDAALGVLNSNIEEITTGNAGINYFHVNSTLADSVASGDESIAIGPQAVASAGRALALGVNAQAIAGASTAVGAGAWAYGYESTAVGFFADTRGDYSSAFGSALAFGKGTTALGAWAYAGGGFDWTGDGNSRPGNIVEIENGTAVGFSSVAAADNATALGAEAEARGDGSLALGHAAQASAAGSVAIGEGSVASADNSVALGAGAVASDVVGTSGTVINGATYEFAGDAPAGTVSVGSVGNERTITNVAAGRIGADSTDAVNGSQLYATNQAVEAISGIAGNVNDLAVKYDWNDNGDSIATPDEIDYGTITLAGPKGTTIDNVAPGFLDAGSRQAVNGSQLFQSMGQVAEMLGGGAVMTENGLTAPTYFIQGSVYNDVGSALQALDVTVSLLDGRPYGGTQLAGYTHARDGQYSPTGDGGAGSTALGVGARATGVEDAVAVGENAMVGADHGTAVGQGAAAMAEGSVALGQASVADRANTVSVGSAGNERQITNVADATQGTDAINKRQLDRGVASANSYTDARVNALSDSFELFQGAVDDRLRKQDRRIDRQGAMGSAMMNMAVSAAGVRTPNRVGVGVGFQGGESALSVGYQRAFSDRATLTFGGAVSSDDTSVGVGAGFGW